MSRTGDSKVIISSSTSSTSAQQNGGKSFMKWFKKKENVRANSHNGNQASRSGNHIDHIQDEANFEDDSSSDTISAPRSPTLSRSSSSSQGSLYSTATTGFAFIPPDQYASFGKAIQPEKRIAPGPLTDTYRQRIRAHERSKEHDRRLDLTLRKKYNIFDTDTLRPSDVRSHSQTGPNNVSPFYNDLSLPNQSTANGTLSPGTCSDCTPTLRQPKRNRRTVSDSSKDRKAGAYLHVKGKRKAPSPPATESDRNSNELSYSNLSPSMSTLARKKRHAPPPPLSPTGPMLQSAHLSQSAEQPQSPISPTSLNGVMKTVLNGGLFNEAEMVAIMNGQPYATPTSPTQIPTEKPTNDDGIESTDTLKLERGILRSNRELTLTSPTQSPSKIILETPTSPKPTCTSPISPRPWYKRSSANNKDQSIPFRREITLKTMEKRKNKDKAGKDSSPPLPEVGYSRTSSLFDSIFTRVISSHHSHHEDHTEKRRSGIGMPNISELDREAAEIINKEKENERNRAQAANDKYYDAPPDTEPTSAFSHERRSSTKDLITRFEETTNPIKFTVNTAFVDKADRYFTDSNIAATKSNVLKTTAVTKEAPATNRLMPSTSSTGSSSSVLSSASSSSTAQKQRIFSNTQQTNDSTNASKNNNKPATATSSQHSVTAVQPDTRTDTKQPRATIENSMSSTATITTTTLNGSTWICAYCTLENYNWRVICEVCERIRPFDKMRAPLATTEPTLVPTPRFRYAKIEASPDEQRHPINAASSSNLINNSDDSNNSALNSRNANSGNQLNKLSNVTSYSLANSASETSVGGVISPNRFTANDSPKPMNKNQSHHMNHRNPELIDSSAVVTTTPAVYEAPHPASHDRHKLSSNSPDLDEMRAVRIAKFTDGIRLRTTPEKPPKTPTRASKSPDGRNSRAPTSAITAAENQQQHLPEKPLLTDRNSLEREKRRLRDMIREMNAKVLEDRYSTNSNENASTSDSSSPKTTEVEVRRPVEVGQGAIRKVFARKSESPDGKIISDTQNYTKCDSTKKIQNPTNPNLKPRNNPPDSLLLLPSPISEINESNLTPSSPTSHALVDQQIDSIYAKLKTENVRDSVEAQSHRRNTAKGLDEFRATLKFNRNRANTVELNKLLKELEMAIGEGEHELAANLAMDLARMKVSLTVTKQGKPAVDDTVNIQKNDELKLSIESKLDGNKMSNVFNVKTDLSSERKSSESSSKNITIEVEENSEFDAAEEGATALPPTKSNSDTLSFGWTCPLCTLINSPNRPGCVVCSETRPANYVVPAAYKVSETYEMPAELLKFLNDDDNLPAASAKEVLRNKDLSTSVLQPKNDLNKTTANRKSAEIFNITITKEQTVTPVVPLADSKAMVQTQIVMTAITESPNITKSRYRGVDNYNPHIKQPPGTSKTTYKSPIVVNPIVKPLRANKLPQLVGVIPKKQTPIVKPKETLPPIKLSAPTKMADLPKESNEHYTQLLHLDNSSIVPNAESFECPICICTIPIGDGVVLRDCIHTFCCECIVNTVNYSDEAEVKCPYIDADYSCDSTIQEREIRALLTKEAYDRHLAVSLKVAEHRADNAFHCRTPGCKGWCVYEDNVNEFKCPICRIVNCLTCRVIHDGLNCKQYQDRMNSDCDTNQEARRTGEMLADMIDKGEAIKCPICQVILMKKWGCDWLKCSMCKTEICWVTRGIRWGPEGKGDTSAGCKCGVNGVKCHPKCNYCH